MLPTVQQFLRSSLGLDDDTTPPSPVMPSFQGDASDGSYPVPPAPVAPYQDEQQYPAPTPSSDWDAAQRPQPWQPEPIQPPPSPGQVLAEDSVSVSPVGTSVADAQRSRRIAQPTDTPLTLDDGSTPPPIGYQPPPQPSDAQIRERQGPAGRAIDTGATAIGDAYQQAQAVAPLPTPDLEGMQQTVTSPEARSLLTTDQPDTVSELWDWRGKVAKGAADAIAQGIGQDPDYALINVEIKGVPIQFTVSDLLQNLTDPLLGAGFSVGDMVLDAASRQAVRIAYPFLRGVARQTAGRLLAAEPVQATGRAIGNAGRAAGREIAGAMLDASPAPRMIGDSGPGIGRALVDDAARQADEAVPPYRYQPEPPPGVQRRYHGTAGAFDAPDPLKFDENGLYGPGYYTTSDPRVASSYAEMTAGATKFNIPQRISDLENELVDLRSMQREGISPPAWKPPLVEQIKRAEDALTELTRSGPNVRAVDVPPDVNLIDADATLTPDTLERVQAVVDQLARNAPEVAAPFQQELALTRRILDQGTPLTNDHLLQNFLELPKLAGQGKGLMTEILDRAGFDGISHRGGQNVPILDAAGQPIQHDVTIIFPKKLEKVTNAFSGTKGGAFLPIDPVSAAAGAGAGTEVDENGNPVGFDPLKAAAGAAIGAVAGTPQGRRTANRIARLAAQRAKQATPPPNMLEIVQSYRHSVGMLGNFSTGLINAVGGPIEAAFGLPTEVIRMGVVRGMPAPVIYEAAELVKGMVQGARAMVGTALGNIPDAVRNAPDFRPPLAERMQGPAGKALGYAIDTPGRIATQAPDALWSTAFNRWGRAREAATMMNESGTSILRPDEQIREMSRLLNNPTPDEAARLDEAARAFAEELTYKGDAGYVEKALGSIFRPGGKTTTSADPKAQQIHDLVGSFFMPFYNSIFKIHKLAATRVPGVGFVANRSLPQDEKVARQLVGLGFTIWAADRAAQGLITGPGAADPDQAALMRDQLPPNSTFIPGVGYVPNDYFGSAGPILNAIGAFYDSRRYASDKEKASDSKYGERVIKDQLRALERFPVAQAFKSLVTMAESPQRGITDLLAGAAGSFSPAPMRTAIMANDPYSRTTDRSAEPLDMLGQKTVQRAGYVPGLGSRTDLPVAQDRFGRPVENPRQGAMGLLPRINQKKGDPLAQVFVTAGMEPSAPPKSLTISTYGADGKVLQSFAMPLNDAEQREWSRLRGEALAELTKPAQSNPAWEQAPSSDRERWLKDKIEQANEYATRKVRESVSDDEIKKRIAPYRKAS